LHNHGRPAPDHPGTASKKRNERNTTHTTLHEALLSRGEADWDRLRKEQAAGVEPEADPDEGEFDESGTRTVAPRRKQAISVRLDPDILEFFKAGGRGYQTRINAALRLYVNNCREAARLEEPDNAPVSARVQCT